MMEIMRIDDYSSDGKNNHTLAKKKKMQKIEPIFKCIPKCQKYYLYCDNGFGN